MSKLLSIIALSGDKSAGVFAAADDVRTSAVFAIRDGNKRNLQDTADALRDNGAVRKDGVIAANKKGAILQCVIHAMNACETQRAAFLAMYPEHKGKPSAAMTQQATQQANTIAAAFEEQAALAIAPKPKAKPALKTAGDAAGDAAAGDAAGDAAAGDAAGDALTPSMLRRMVAVYQSRLARRDAHIAALNAELAELRIAAQAYKSDEYHKAHKAAVRKAA